jgi:hypothetical protein
MIHWIYKPEIPMGILFNDTKKVIVRKEQTDPESELFAFLIAHAYLTTQTSRTQTKKRIYEYPLRITTDKNRQQDLILGVLLYRFLRFATQESKRIFEDILLRQQIIDIFATDVPEELETPIVISKEIQLIKPLQKFSPRDLFKGQRLGLPIELRHRQTGETHQFLNRVLASRFMGFSDNYLNSAINKEETYNKLWSWKDLNKEDFK